MWVRLSALRSFSTPITKSRSGGDSFQGSGGMIWPNYTHADTYIEGGWEALCEKKLVDTYYFDAVKARKEDEKNIASALMIEAIRENRKKSMYKEDVREENEPLHIRKI
jgi:hypothetical protein